MGERSCRGRASLICRVECVVQALPKHGSIPGSAGGGCGVSERKLTSITQGGETAPAETCVIGQGVE